MCIILDKVGIIITSRDMLINFVAELLFEFVEPEIVHIYYYFKIIILFCNEGITQPNDVTYLNYRDSFFKVKKEV